MAHLDRSAAIDIAIARGINQKASKKTQRDWNDLFASYFTFGHDRPIECLLRLMTKLFQLCHVVSDQGHINTSLPFRIRSNFDIQWLRLCNEFI